MSAGSTPSPTPGGLVAHRVRPTRGLHPHVGIPDVADHGVDVGPPPGWWFAPVRGERIEHDDVLTMFDEEVDDMGPDEPGAAGDQNPHPPDTTSARTSGPERARPPHV